MEGRYKEDIEKELSKALHLKINFNLVKLRMIKDLKVKEDRISIKEDPIILLRNSMKNFNKNIKVRIETVEMNEKENFMELVGSRWKF